MQQEVLLAVQVERCFAGAIELGRSLRASQAHGRELCESLLSRPDTASLDRPTM